MRESSPAPDDGRRVRGLYLEPLAVSHAEEMFDGLRDGAAYSFLPDDPPKSVDALRARYARQCAGPPTEARCGSTG